MALKNSNEALQGLNQELRCANQELKKIRNELQSINTGLTTANAELKSKLDQLARSNNDLKNLMAATDIATVFLDRDLRLQRYTPSAKTLFNLIAADLGSPLSDLSRQIDYPQLVADAERALTLLQPTQREVSAGAQRYIARTLPYRTAEDTVAGVVLSFLDITEQNRAEQEIIRLAAASERQRRMYEAVLMNTPDFVYVFSLDYRVLYANESLIHMWGRGYDGAIGKTFLEIGYEPWHAAMHEREIDLVTSTRQPIRGEVPFHGTNGRRDYDYIFVPVIGADGEVEAVAGTTRDVTERKEAERKIREGQEQLDFALIAADLGQWALNLRDFTMSRTVRHDQIFGYDTLLPAWTYQMLLAHVVPADRALVDASFQNSVATGAPWAIECRIRRADGAVRYIWAKGIVRRDVEGKVERMLGIIGDITERRQAEDRQAFQIRLNETLRPLSTAVEVQAAASRLLGEQLEANRVVYFEIYDDEYVIEQDYTAGVRPLAGRYPVAAFGPALLAALLEGRTVVESDATTEPGRPAAEQAAFATIQVRAHVDVPLLKRGRFVAGMTVHIAEQRDWTPQEVSLIEETAERTWATLERVRAEASLKESEQRFRLVADAAPVLIWVSGTDQLSCWFNQPWLAFTGRSMTQEVDNGWADGIHPDDADHCFQVYRAAFTARHPFSREYRLRRHDGTFRWLIDNGAPRFRSSGEFDGYIGSCIDVTEYKIAEASLQEAARQKDEFLATLAHELRNPLAPIRSGLQLIKKVGVTGTIEQARSIMERQLIQMTRLIDDLLDVSRLTTGKLELHMERLPLQDIISAALETTQPVIEQKEHRLSVILPEHPVCVEGDRVRLAQVLSNLLNNSAKYTHRNGHIRVSLSIDGATAILTVADDGIGIPAPMLATVFGMFTQVDRALEKKSGGLGIGLALVKRLVHMHGGTVTAYSAGEDQGAEFTVRLPIATDTTQQAAPSNAVATMMRPTAPLRILIVDDNEDAADTLGQLLEIMGNEVRTSYDGESGIQAVQAFQPHVLLCDIGMPRMNGYDTARRIRAELYGQNTVLVALTGWNEGKDLQKSAEAGFDHHLVKPVEIGALMELLTDIQQSKP
ncbi:MAG: PAS domain S-box protein [Sphingomonadaceae bacterium]